MSLPESEYAIVMGESHVRAFARHRSFLPLFIGSGKETCFVTPAHAAATTEKLLRNIERLDPRLLILTLGEPDVRLHLENKHGTRDGGPASDLPQVEVAVQRYLTALRAIRECWSAPIVVLSSPPTPRAEHNRLARIFNDRLAAGCAECGLRFLDLWNELMLPDGEVVDPRFSADHVHLNEHIVPIVVPRLQQLGLLSADVSTTNDFDWTYLYRIPVGVGETRVWGDANMTSAQHLRKFGRSEMVASCMKRIAAVLDREKVTSVLIAQAREGFAAFSLPARAGQSIAAWDFDAPRVCAGERLRRFARRNDITMHCGDWRNAEPADVVIALADDAVFAGYPEDDEAQRSRTIAAARLSRVGAFFLTTDLPSLELHDDEWRRIDSCPISYQTPTGEPRRAVLVWAGKKPAQGWRARLRRLVPQAAGL